MWVAFQEGLGARALEPQELVPPAAEPAAVAPTAQHQLRAFYSGHSLTDGLPEQVLRLSGVVDQAFDFEFQSLPGSTIRERTRGEDPNGSGWAGLRAGRNREGGGLDVEAALRAQGGAAPYDVLVVTERHDLPYAIGHEGTTLYLQRLHALLLAGNPRGRTWLAHSWLEFDAEQPEIWIAYERQALVLWECVASAVNRELGGAPSVFVVPGGAALAQLVEHVVEEGLPGLPAGGTQSGAGFLFRDSVHLSQWGQLFMGAVHYGALWGLPPRWSQGALVAPPHPAGGDARELAEALLEISWQYMAPYLEQARARAQRAPAVCRRYAAFMAGRLAAHGRGELPPGWLGRFRATRSLRSALRRAPGFAANQD